MSAGSKPASPSSSKVTASSGTPSLEQEKRQTTLPLGRPCAKPNYWPSKKP